MMFTCYFSPKNCRTHIDVIDTHVFHACLEILIDFSQVFAKFMRNTYDR